MLLNEYSKLYNRIYTDVIDCENILFQTSEFLKQHLKEIDLIIVSKFEKGNLHTLYNLRENTIYDSSYYSSYPLLTRDIHKDTYEISPCLISRTFNQTIIPYLTKSNYDTFVKDHNLIENKGIIQLNLYVESILTYSLSLFIDSSNLSKLLGLDESQNINNYEDFYITKELYNDLLFIRNTLEQQISKCYLTSNGKVLSNLLGNARQLLVNNHSLAADCSNFFTRILDYIFEVSDEGDLGCVMLFQDGRWFFAHGIGHDMSQLSKIQLADFRYALKDALDNHSIELASNIYLIDDPISYINAFITEVNQEVIDAMVSGLSNTSRMIQLQVYFQGTLKGILVIEKNKASKEYFSNFFVQILKQCELLAHILLYYSELESYAISFRQLTNLISSMVDFTSESDSRFLKHFLKLLVNSLNIIDYAALYIKKDGHIHFLETIGHDLAGLNTLNLKTENFIDALDGPILLDNTLDDCSKRMSPEQFKQFSNYSKQVKSSLISEFNLIGGDIIGISVDIKKTSYMGFTKEAIAQFDTLSNLGFTFYSNAYYIGHIKNLNESLESQIKDRTKELMNTNRKLLALVKQDSLTGLYNHKHIIEHLNKLIKEQAGKFSIFLFDIDYFKRINDEYGHLVGDKVLADISRMIQEDSSIIAGRYGGEEFLILLPNYDLPDAVTYAQSLLHKIEKANFIEGSIITVSGGVVAHQKGSSNEMIQIADELLYKAKNNGRNRIDYNYC